MRKTLPKQNPLLSEMLKIHFDSTVHSLSVYPSLLYVCVCVCVCVNEKKPRAFLMKHVISNSGQNKHQCATPHETSLKKHMLLQLFVYFEYGRSSLRFDIFVIQYEKQMLSRN